MAEVANECKSENLKRKRKHSRNPHSKDWNKRRKLEPSKRNRDAKKTRIIQPQLPQTATEISSNWKALHALLEKEKNTKETTGDLKQRHKKMFKRTLKPKPKLDNIASSKEVWFDDVDPEDLEEITGKKTKTETGDANDMLVTGSLEGITKRIALDCEMVGVGSDAKRHMLARVSIVNSHGHVVYDSFVAPQEKVVDYRTHVSGIRSENLKNAPEFKTVQLEVSKILKEKILVGHSLKNDLEVQDAQVAMKLYTLHRKQWERQLHEARVKPSKNALVNKLVTTSHDR
ncbi:RNA exonuclease 4-like isoform X2 [Stylophora pistillata]|uniref:RNA exonuclease 4-like isoform X2 n=1 Tax=Stylophora pistillata TaxID=50429 RepID=UPI000C04156D|nr:RNA exonuclease 4-like isoform X2 [Stylophora pistillata]